MQADRLTPGLLIVDRRVNDVGVVISASKQGSLVVWVDRDGPYLQRFQLDTLHTWFAAGDLWEP